MSTKLLIAGVGCAVLGLDMLLSNLTGDRAAANEYWRGVALLVVGTALAIIMAKKKLDED